MTNTTDHRTLIEQLVGALEEWERVDVIGREPHIHRESWKQLVQDRNTKHTAALAAGQQALEKTQVGEIAGAQSRFKNVAVWTPCTVEHHQMVQLNPGEWDGYETRLVYAHPQATEPAWRPIETAPKDGSEILLAHPDGSMVVGWWREDRTRGKVCGWSDGWSDGDDFAMTWPSHWMPIPAAPEAKQ